MSRKQRRVHLAERGVDTGHQSALNPTMRIATLIIGLVLTIGLFAQSMVAAAGGSLASDKDLQDAAAWGILSALLFLIASALVMAKPRFSMWTFFVVAVISFIAGRTSAFTDLMFWAVVAFVLGFMSWRGSVEKSEKDSHEAARDDALLAAAETIRAAQSGAATPQA